MKSKLTLNIIYGDGIQIVQLTRKVHAARVVILNELQMHPIGVVWQGGNLLVTCSETRGI